MDYTGTCVHGDGETETLMHTFINCKVTSDCLSMANLEVNLLGFTFERSTNGITHSLTRVACYLPECIVWLNTPPAVIFNTPKLTLMSNIMFFFFLQ